MSLSQRRRWQQDFARLQAQFSQRSFIPTDFRKPGLVEGVKAGLSLVALSPEPLSATLLNGQECYNSSGTLVTGNLDFASVYIDAWNTAGQVTTTVGSSITTYFKILRAKLYVKAGTVTIKFHYVSIGGDDKAFHYIRVTEDDVVKVAEFNPAGQTVDVTKTYVSAGGIVEIALEAHNTVGKLTMGFYKHSDASNVIVCPA